MAGRALLLVVVLLLLGAAKHRPAAAAAASHGPGGGSSSTTAATATTTTVPSATMTRCSTSCLHRKQIERDTVESIKGYILDKLGLSEPPKIPRHLRLSESAIDVLLNRTVSAGSASSGADDEGGAQRDQASRTSLDDAMRQPRDCDDDSAKPRKVIAFAESGTNGSQQCARYEGNRIHFFRFSKEVMSYKVASAKLWVYLQAPDYYNSTLSASSDPLPALHNITSDGRPNTHHKHQHARPHTDDPQQFGMTPQRSATTPPTSLHYLTRSPPGGATVLHRAEDEGSGDMVVLTVLCLKHLSDGAVYVWFLTTVKVPVPASRGKWVHVDLTRSVADWFRKPDGEFGVVLSAADDQGRVLRVSSGDDHNGIQTPFIELTPSLATKATRSRRSLSMDCDGTTEEKRCCRYPLTIDFEKFEWDWIIAPKTYEANYCAGDCPYVFLQRYPHSYIIQMTNRTICCAPRKMAPISMLYFNTEHNILHSTLPGMTVVKCGCF